MARLANDKAAAKDTAMSAKFWKGKTAQAIGKPELADAADEDVLAAHDKHMALCNEMDDADAPDVMTTDNEKKNEAAVALANERKELATELLDVAVTEGRIKAEDKPTWETEFTADFTATKAKLANVKTPSEDPAVILANERKERTAELIGAAIVAGRIKPADKPTWETEFTADFTATKAKLANVKAPVIKTEAKTKGIGERSGAALQNEQGRRDKVQQLVNEKEKAGLSYDAAFAAVQREHPEIFEAMEKPEAKK
jgi:hypothetical protein